MAIQPLTNKTNNVVLSAKSVPEEKAASTNVHAAKQTQDSVAMSAFAKQITKAFESSKTAPIIDEGRVKAVREALKNETYIIDAEQIAKKMIQMEQEQLNSR